MSRSFYVPLTLEVCDHLDGAVLCRGNEPLRRLPVTQIFLFTYYPERNRVVPEIETVRVEGNREGGTFRTELVVSPASVYAGSKKIDLDLDEQLERLRRHVGSRHEPVVLKLRCSKSARELREASR